jgi:hypothetical protein
MLERGCEAGTGVGRASYRRVGVERMASACGVLAKGAAAVGGAGATGRLSGESEEGGRCCMRRWVCCKGERERGPARHAYARHMGKAGDGGGGRGAGCQGRVCGEHAQVKKSWVLGTPDCFFQSV